MSVINAENFIQKLVSDSDFQIDVLKIAKPVVGNLEAMVGRKDGNELLKAALPAANQLGFDCSAEELTQAFKTATKNTNPLKMLKFVGSMAKNAKKVDQGTV